MHLNVHLEVDILLQCPAQMAGGNRRPDVWILEAGRPCGTFSPIAQAGLYAATPERSRSRRCRWRMTIDG